MNETCIMTEEEADHYVHITVYTLAGITILCCMAILRKCC